MCKTKAEGGRCNGWYAKEISRLTELASNVANDEYNEANVKKLHALKNKIEQRKQDIKDKPLVEIPENMTVADLKREHKKLKKTAEIYRKYDPIKYKQLQRKVGEQVRKNVFKTSMSQELADKVNSTGLKVNELIDVYKASKSGDALFKMRVSLALDKKRESFPKGHKFKKVTIENIHTILSNEEYKQLIEVNDKDSARNLTEENLDNFSQFLNNDLKIETGNPNKNLLLKATARDREFYEKIDKTVPTKFFKKIKESSLKQVEIPHKYEKGDLEYLSNKFEVDLTKTDEEIKNQINNNPKNSYESDIFRRGKWNTYEVVEVNRDTNNKVVSFDVITRKYETGQNVPQSKSDTEQWVEIEPTEEERQNKVGNKKLYKCTEIGYERNHFDKDFYGEENDSDKDKIANAFNGYGRLSDVDDFHNTGEDMANLFTGMPSNNYHTQDTMLGEMFLS